VNLDAIPAALRQRPLCGCGCGAELPTPRYPSEQRRFINGHYARLQTGQLHSHWKGGKLTDRGHRLVRLAADDPFAVMRNSGGYVMEHRLVMARHLGRPLLPREVVHHKLRSEGGSGDRTDNRLENLTLFPNQSAHMAHHRTIECGRYWGGK